MAHKCRLAERSRQIGPKTIKSRGTTATTPFLLAILLAAVAVWLAATTSPATGADALSNVKLMNFCERMNILSNLSNPLFNAETALYNMTVVVGYNLDAPPQTITIDPETKVPVGGFIVTLLNEVSSRGAFRVTYKLVKNSSSYANTDAFLNDVLPGVDLYAGMPVADTTWRRTLYNMDFTREIVDMSIVLASPGVVVKPVRLPVGSTSLRLFPPCNPAMAMPAARSCCGTSSGRTPPRCGCSSWAPSSSPPGCSTRSSVPAPCPA